MQVTPKKNNTIHYLPQEIRETRLTEVTYLPITREMLEMKPSLVKDIEYTRTRNLIRN